MNDLAYSVHYTESLVIPSLPLMAKSVLQTVAYADVFDYPLTSTEIHRYLIGVRTGREELRQFLQDFRLLTNADIYYTLPGREKLAGIRRRREQTASWLWTQANGYGQIIARLPFVRMVAVTGALAMNNVDTGADIDYLIVTEPGRLWLCRAFVLLIGRLAALKGITLCPNYLVTLHTLDFPDHTLYAAHEIVQMVPLSGWDVYDQICRQNAWVADFLPNAQWASASLFISSQQVPPFPAHRVTEAVLRTPLFSILEQWEMKRKIRRLRFEQSASPESDFSADYCKGHAQRHQAHTMVALNERLNRLQHELTL